MKKNFLNLLTIILVFFVSVSCRLEETDIDKSLSAPVISYNESNKLVSWSEVTNAERYVVKVNGLEKVEQEEISYSLTDLEADTYKIVIYAKASGYTNSPESNELSCIVSIAKIVLEAPIISKTESTVSWSEIVGARGYIVAVNGSLMPEQTATSYTVTGDFGNYVITVIAVASDIEAHSNSIASNSVTVELKEKVTLSTPVLSITSNIVSWVAISGAKGYILTINGVAQEEQTSASYTVTGEAGDYAITVVAVAADTTVNKNSDSSNTVTITIPKITYEVIFKDFDGTVLSSQIINERDAAVAPASPTRDGYVFIGWDKSFSNITGNIIITAVYQESEHLVTIIDILNSTIGVSYKTRGQVLAISSRGFLLYDGSFIFVYLGVSPAVSINDIVLVKGTTSLYGGKVQFASNITVLFENIGSDFNFEEQKITDLADYMTKYNVGDYIVAVGTLNISGSNYNIMIDGSGKQLSINYPVADATLTDLDGKKIIVTGYPIYTVSNNMYLNFILTSYDKYSEIENLVNLNILSVNDLHGYIEQDSNGQNGLSNMAYLINQIRKNYGEENVLLIGNGDMFQGTGISNMTKGLAVLDCMNQMGFNAMGIGNHEFDWELETILQYFDGNPNNGEANFPLLNANIYYVGTNLLVRIIDGKIIMGAVYTCNNLKVGFISYIGDIYSSIAYSQAAPYEFDLNIAASVTEMAVGLKGSGADIIVVNIHGGTTGDITQYGYNVALAALKDADGKYLVDAVINGHTHYYQTGYIYRTGGVAMPVVQAGSYCRAFGNITLTIDLNTKTVKNVNVQLIYTSTAGTNYDADVQEIIDNYDNQIGNAALVTAGEMVYSTSYLQEWIGNVVLAATGADVFVSNTGGIRTTGNIQLGKDVSIKDLYELSPFDNDIYLMRILGSDLNRLLSSSAVFSIWANGVTYNANETYTLAVISYVYYFNELNGVRDESKDFNTNMYVRDLLIEDLFLYNENEIFYPISKPEAKIGLLIENPFVVNLNWYTDSKQLQMLSD